MPVEGVGERLVRVVVHELEVDDGVLDLDGVDDRGRGGRGGGSVLAHPDPRGPGGRVEVEVGPDEDLMLGAVRDRQADDIEEDCSPGDLEPGPYHHDEREG